MLSNLRVFVYMEEKLKCVFCDSNISKEKFGVHLKAKHSGEFKNSIELYKYYFSMKENLTMDEIDVIIEDYENKSVLYIENKYDFKFRKYVDKLGLQHKSISDSVKTASCQEKRNETNRKRFGVDNPSQSQEIKDKKKETFLKNYGVDNIWKLKEYRTWWESFVKEKYGKVCLADLYNNQNHWGWNDISESDKHDRIVNIHNGYKSWYLNLSAEEKIKYNQLRSKGIVHAGRSKLEIRIEHIMNTNNIYNKPQYWINQKSYDFYVGHRNIIEVQGTYWHCDPRFYSSTDIVKFGDETYSASNVWEKDNEKKILAENYGYNVYYIWEFDINQMCDDGLLIFINNINENKINQKNSWG